LTFVKALSRISGGLIGSEKRVTGRLSRIERKWWTLAAACLGLGMLMVNTFVVNVALPAMARDLDADLGTAQWIVSAYVLVLGVFPVAGGRLGDIFGRRRVYLAGLAVFVAASLAAGVAQDVYVLIAFRVVQGIGAAVMMPGTLSIVTQAFPLQQRGLAIGIWSGVSGLGLIIGPVLGGLLVNGDSWRPIFYVNIPIGLAALWMALAFIPESRDESAPRAVDWPGMMLLSSALFLLMFGVTRASAVGWTAPLILACLAGGTFLVLVFVGVERARRYPLVDLSLFRSVTFVTACFSAFLFSAAVFGSQPYTSLFMQNFWKMTPLEAGLAFIPSTFLVALLMPFSGIMGQRLGHRLRFIVMTGSVSVSLSFLYLLGLDTESRYLDGFLPAFILRGVGIGLVMSATSLAVVSAVPLAKSGLASGTLTMSRNVGTAVGVALFGAVFLHYVDAEVPARLAGQPPAEVAAATVAADRFVAVGEGPTLAATEQMIVDGFVLLAIVAAVLCAVAMAAAGFIRHQAVVAVRPPLPETRVEPTPEEAPAK
jgi:MFS transporter, DHA2 family, methylenomycin A resistance protein